MDDQDLLRTFETELRQGVLKITEVFLSLDHAKKSDRGAHERLHEAYRLTHSIKGASRVVGLDSVEALAHDLEDRLQTLVRSEELPEANEIDAFLKCADGFTKAFDDFVQGSYFDPSPLLAALHATKKDGNQDAIATATPPVSSAPEEAIPQAAGTPEPVRGQAPERRKGDLLRGPKTGESPASALADETSIPSPPKELAGALKHEEMVRIPATGLDQLFRGVKEAFLIETRITGELAQVSQHVAEAPGAQRLVATLEREVSRLHGVLLGFHELVRSFRMEPIDKIRVPLQRAVRDLASSLQKRVVLNLTARRELVDAAMLDALLDPLVHLVRNAVDHGLESPEDRIRAGKDPEGTIEVGGATVGAHLELFVADDGRGIDAAKIRKKAIEQRLAPPEEVAQWSEAECHEALFKSGFSTAAAVSSISGRGLGLDIVRARVRRLGGDIQLTSQPGLGTRFLMRLPVGLLTPRVLLLRIGTNRVGIAVDAIERVVRTAASELRVVSGRLVAQVQQEPIAVSPLSAVVGWEASSGEPPYIVVLSREGARRGFLVDEVLGEVEQPSLPAPWNLRGLTYLSGLLVMSDGSLVPLLEAREVFKNLTATGTVETDVGLGALKGGRKSVLVADDSPTILALHRSILTAEGYEVLTASDGAEAIAVLERKTVDLLLTDIEMPRMDGLALIARMRQNPVWRHIPAIVISQYGRREDLDRAADAGADRYIVKSSFKPAELMEMIRDLT